MLGIRIKKDCFSPLARHVHPALVYDRETLAPEAKEHKQRANILLRRVSPLLPRFHPRLLEK